MNIVVTDDYKQMSKMVADEITGLMQIAEDPLICTASGDSPAGVYKEIVDRVKKLELDISGWNFLSLDEWVGLNGDDEGSCRFHLNNQLFSPLKIPADKISFFDGRANDLQAECVAAEDFISQHGGIDVAIIGLGLNGHVGMNEPGSDPELHTHISELDPITKQTGQKYFTKEQELTQGITLGIKNLLESRHVFLLISGSHKAKIVKQLLEDEISTQLPGTLLRNHPGLRIYLDREAASLLSK